MLLMFKEQFNCWVWVGEENTNYELSPRYDSQIDALQWRGDVSFEIHRDYSLLALGKRVVIPVNRSHAHMILDNVVRYLQKEDNYESPLAAQSAPKPTQEALRPNTATRPSTISVNANFSTPVPPGVPARPN